MRKTVLITGGAGFIGSHVADELIARGHRVRALDNLDSQVHGPDAQRPAYLNRTVELVRGDVRDESAVRRALADVDAVIHLAARVGVGQSMYQLADYTSVNNLGTAVLLEALIRRPVARLVVASSMSVYGEGLYADREGRLEASIERSPSALRRGDWEPRTADGRSVVPVPTPEWKTPALASLYALSKYDQERMCLMVGQSYEIPTVALRLFNVFGPRQALSNPYTGVLAIFASRLLNRRAPLVFEDGKQRRDFVSVHDVARAFCLALTAPDAPGKVLNIGSGRSRTVRQVAEQLAGALGVSSIRPEITGKYRVGDIRHCTADISAARAALGYEPNVRFEDGLSELVGWLADQTAVDRVAEMRDELVTRGLTV
jgi:dTDP-L-rhamnose 4-epimerase